MRYSAWILLALLPATQAFAPNKPSFVFPQHVRNSVALDMTTEKSPASPKTFREAEVLGLKYMQDGQYEEALDGE